MIYRVQKLGFDGRNRRWFTDENAPSSKRDAIKYASTRAWGNGSEYRVVDDDGAQVWPSEDA